MACKNCKGKKIADKLESGFNDTQKKIQNHITNRQQQILKEKWDTTMGKFDPFEQVVLTLFAWIPLGLGYFTIIKFIVSIF